MDYIDITVLLYELQGAIAKWLQRQIRNLFLFEGAGSNPAGVVIFIFIWDGSFSVLFQ